MVHADEAVRTFANIESVIRGYGGGSVQSRQRHADRRLPRNVEDSPSTGLAALKNWGVCSWPASLLTACACQADAARAS
jgi:hypothetical protein